MEPFPEKTSEGGRDPYDAEPRPPLPSLPARLAQAFLSPGKLMDALASDPRWLGAFLLSAGLAVVAAALVPPDLTAELVRRRILESGQDMPPEFDAEAAAALFRWLAIGGSALQMVLLTFLFAAFYSVVFAFILGDEGRFKQYLAALCHAWFIPAFLSVLLVPLWIATGNLELRPNAVSFFFFLPEGLLRNALTVLDLTHIWATLVFAQGVHAIDARRSFGSAASIGLGVLLVIVFGLGWLQTLGQGG